MGHLSILSRSFIYSRMYVYHYGLIDTYLVYNPVLHYLFSCSNCSSFDHWKLFPVGSHVSLTYTSLRPFCEGSLTSCHRRTFPVPLHCPCPSPGMSCLREPWFLLWRMAFRNRGLWSVCWECLLFSRCRCFQVLSWDRARK